jgi:L-rhamnose mutarotase
MERVAFKMFLHPGKKDEYKRRHDEIWPELASLLREAGIRNYSIHLDEDTNVLFGYLERADASGMEKLPDHPVMKRWWDYMKDIMEYDGDRPRTVLLTETFFLS